MKGTTRRRAGKSKSNATTALFSSRQKRVGSKRISCRKCAAIVTYDASRFAGTVVSDCEVKPLEILTSAAEAASVRKQIEYGGATREAFNRGQSLRTVCLMVAALSLG
jgi:hypothetical protein